MAYAMQGKNTEYLCNTSLEIWDKHTTWRVYEGYDIKSDPRSTEYDFVDRIYQIQNSVWYPSPLKATLNIRFLKSQEFLTRLTGSCLLKQRASARTYIYTRGNCFIQRNLAFGYRASSI